MLKYKSLLRRGARGNGKNKYLSKRRRQLQSIRKGLIEMGTIAAAPEREPLFEREITLDGASRLERYRQFRAAFLACLREGGEMSASSSYTFPKRAIRDGNRLQQMIEVTETEKCFEAEIPNVIGEKVKMCIFPA